MSNIIIKSENITFSHIYNLTRENRTDIPIHDGETEIKLSQFNGKKFYNSVVPEISGNIKPTLSIKDNFKGQLFRIENLLSFNKCRFYNSLYDNPNILITEAWGELPPPLPNEEFLKTGLNFKVVEIINDDTSVTNKLVGSYISSNPTILKFEESLKFNTSAISTSKDAKFYIIIKKTNTPPNLNFNNNPNEYKLVFDNSSNKVKFITQSQSYDFSGNITNTGIYNFKFEIYHDVVTNTNTIETSLTTNTKIGFYDLSKNLVLTNEYDASINLISTNGYDNSGNLLVFYNTDGYAKSWVDRTNRIGNLNTLKLYDSSNNLIPLDFDASGELIKSTGFDLSGNIKTWENFKIGNNYLIKTTTSYNKFTLQNEEFWSDGCYIWLGAYDETTSWNNTDGKTGVVFQDTTLELK